MNGFWAHMAKIFYSIVLREDCRKAEQKKNVIRGRCPTFECAAMDLASPFPIRTMIQINKPACLQPWAHYIGTILVFLISCGQLYSIRERCMDAEHRVQRIQG
jgi:hypothetical protein